MMKTHDMQSGGSCPCLSCLPTRFSHLPVSIAHRTASDSLTALCRLQPHMLRSTTLTPCKLRSATRSPRRIAAVPQLLSTTNTTIPCEILEFPQLHKRRNQLLSIRNGPSKSSLNARGSEMRQRTISNSSCPKSRSASTCQSLPKR